MPRRSGVLEMAVLGLLHEAPMHGYELRKRLNAVLGWGRALSYGSLYPCLKAMLRKGWISEDTAAGRADARDGTSPALAGRRARIVYQITADGKEHFLDLLAECGPSAWEDENFDVHFAFFARTDVSVRLRILEGRRTRLEERLERLRGALQRTRERLDSYTIELHRHGLESVEREVRWLNELIEAERGGGQTTGAATSPGGVARDRHAHEDVGEATDKPASPHPPGMHTDRRETE